MSSSQVVSTASIYKLPIEAIHFIFEYMTEKDQLNFSLTCSWIYRVFRVYHFGYASPKWIPINITQIHRSNDPSSCENIPNAPPSANYRDGVLLDGKLYLTIFEKESPICWILDFDEIPLSWKRANVTFVESESEEDSEGLETSDSADDKKSNIHVHTSKPQVVQYQPLRSTAAAAISPIIYFFGGECLNTGEPIDTLYKLDTRNMLLRQVKGQDGNLPSARKMHSLNTINNQFLALFGGRCLLMNDHPREFDSKDFYVYDISTKVWTIYRDSHEHIPYARSLHSTTVLECTLYVYGGQQITSSSTPDSQIHDDDDLWCFTFNSQDLPEEGQNTPESNTSNRTSNRSESPISVSFQNDRWQKLFSPRNKTSSVFSGGIGGEWHTTTGDDVGRRCGAAMFNVGKRVAVLGGYERDNWKWNEKEKILPSEGEKSKDLSNNNNDNDSENIDKEQKGKESDELKHTSTDKETTERKRVEIEKPWELCKIYLPNRKRWDQVRILDFPEMECIAITRDQTNSNVFVMGRKKGDTEEQGITMGWIREEFGNN